VADVIAVALRPVLDERTIADLRARVTTLADRHPLYAALSPARC